MFGLLRRRLAPQLLGVIAAAAPAAAQAPDDTTRLEPVVVTVTRMEQKATTDGVISIGQPFMARGGLRLRFF